LEQSLINKVRQLAQRILNKPTTKNITQRHSSSAKIDEEGDIYHQHHHSKRRASNSEETFIQALIDELNFSQYKSAYIALVEFYDLPVRGYHSSSQFANASDRKVFLKNFAESYYQKLHWGDC
jgi:ribosomal protein L2